MVSQYFQDKFHLLQAIDKGFHDFDDIMHYINTSPRKTRGLIKYFLTHHDIYKTSEKPCYYELTNSGRKKLQYWYQKTKNTE